MSTFPELVDRVVFVTGGASGIGRGIVEAFAAQGSRVVSADLAYPSGVLATTDDEHVWTIGLDVSDESAVVSALALVTDELGLVETVALAAGISTMGFAIDTDVEDWDRNLSINARGSFLVAKHVAGALARAGRTGQVVFIASQAGKNGYRGMAAYVASKHAVLGLTKTMAVELAPAGIRVNAVCPGIIETPMKHRERIEGAALRGLRPDDILAEDRSQVPLGRTGTPADVAGVVLFLASDLSSYMTGQGINVTGGMTTH